MTTPYIYFAEGKSASESDTFASIIVNLTEAIDQPIYVTLETADGTAISGEDYSPVDRTVTFLPGQTSITVDIPILNDVLLEPREYFTLDITSASQGIILGGSALVEITNDDYQKPFRHELEDSTTIEGFRPEYVSSRKVLSFRGGSSNETGSISFDFNGLEGDYDIIVGAYDENDGEGSFDLSVNDDLIGTHHLVGDLGSNIPVDQTKINVTFDSINLQSGDTITLNGYEHSLEHIRLDYIDFVPSSLPHLSGDSLQAEIDNYLSNGYSVNFLGYHLYDFINTYVS